MYIYTYICTGRSGRRVPHNPRLLHGFSVMSIEPCFGKAPECIYPCFGKAPGYSARPPYVFFLG